MNREIEVFCTEPLQCIKGKVIKVTDFGVLVKPESDGEIVLAASAE